jgi:2-oxoglutarate dehydrogenase E2 component (dihydrolipoamide succinyltransferase)
MAVDVKMPRLGESVVEGTVLKWLVREGEAVAKDQALLSVSTDKVDAEIPSPAAGVVESIRAKEGEVLPVDALLCTLRTEGAAAAAPPETGRKLGWDEEDEGFPGHMARGSAPPLPAPPFVAEAPPAVVTPPPAPAPPAAPAAAPPVPAAAVEAGRPSAPPPAAPPPAAPAAVPGGAPAAAPSVPALPGGGSGVRVTPVVSRMAADHGIDLSRIPGTGIDGRVTKRDVERYLEGGAAAPSVPGAEALRPAPPAAPAAAPPAGATPAAGGAPAGPADFVPPKVVVEEGDETVPFTPVRRRIAAHMVASKRTSPHVHAVAEVDLSAVNRHRAAAKERGETLTFLPYVMRAAVLAFADHPRLNALVSGGDTLVVKRAVHMAVAVETDRGLLVPVVRHAEAMGLSGLSAAVEELSRRAREKRITPDEMAGGTFSVSNPGPKGNLFGMAILNQPQVGILRMGQVVRRPVVVTEPDGGEAIAVRPMMYLTLGYDHRVVDGVEGNGFLFRVREILESGSFGG